MLRRFRRLGAFGLAVFVAYVLITTFGGCADQLILHPSTQPIDAKGAEQFFIKHDSQSIEVFRARSPGAIRAGQPQAFMLEFCGNSTRAESIAQIVAQRWGDHPIEAWVMNYPGYGQSTGSAAMSSIPGAALATYDEISRGANGRPIFVSGNSLGTAAALYVATMRPAAGMILQDPPPLQRMILQRSGWWNLWLAAGPIALQVPGELNSLVNAPKMQSPAVFINSMEDTVVPVEYKQLVIDAYAGPKQVIRLEHAEHNSSITGEDARRFREAMDWLWNLARDAKRASD